MSIYDDEFDMRAYLQSKLMDIESLESRRLFKDVAGKLLLELHGEMERQYRGLEQRVLEEIPMPLEGPVIITNLVEKRLYDVTDVSMFPMCPGDLDEICIEAKAVQESLRNGKIFLLYTVFLQADYLETVRFEQQERVFRGSIGTQHGEYAARFRVARNISYYEKIAQMYDIFRINYLPWRSVCAPYLFKLFDVYIESVENWDFKDGIVSAEVDFEEYQESIVTEPLPVWNISPFSIKTSTYPEPCVDKTNYEHRIFRHLLRDDARYLVTNGDVVIENIRLQQEDMIITCPEENPIVWEMYQCSIPMSHVYPRRLMSNMPKDTFMGRVSNFFQQAPKTKLEVDRLLSMYSFDQDLVFVDMRLIPNNQDKETYCVDAFIQDEIRCGKWETALQIDFRPTDYGSYLNRDIMSFLVACVQRHFPEYECCGRLV